MKFQTWVTRLKKTSIEKTALFKTAPNFFLDKWKRNETKGEEEYCWATTRHWGGHAVAGQVSSVLETMYSVPYVYWIPTSTRPDRTWFGESWYIR